MDQWHSYSRRWWGTKSITVITLENIIQALPYSEPFLFVESIEKMDESGVIGSYTFPKESYFYKGHFANYPITPGVILIETMAQIGLVCLGIFLISTENPSQEKDGFVMTSSEIEFLAPVFPEEKVSVKSEKIYFRFGKLKCKVEMRNSKDEIVCSGTLAGMMVKR